jgi:hypothetical protein
MVAILALILFLMQVTGTSNITNAEGGFWGFLKAFFSSTRGVLFTIALVVWSAFYPAFKDRMKRKES